MVKVRTSLVQHPIIVVQYPSVVFATDSTVLAHVMKTLNDRYRYGLELFLLSIDEGITGYRDDSLEVLHLQNPCEMPTLIELSYRL